MKKYLILLLIFVACQETETIPPDIPPEVIWQPFYAGLESGDSLQFVSFDPPLEFPGHLVALNDSVFVDTLYLDLDTNLINDFIFIYSEEYWNPIPKPSFQSFDVVSLQGIQLSKNEVNWENLIYRCDSGQIIDLAIPWIWELKTRLCYRQNNLSVGSPQGYCYLIFNKPILGDRKFGWLRLKLELEDYYYKSLIIDGYAIKDY